MQPGVFFEPPGAVHRGVLDEAALKQVWDEVGKCYGYLKSDGWRVQIHNKADATFLYSREGIDYSHQFPSLVKNLKDAFQEKSLILDTEVVGYDQSGRHVPPARIRRAAKHVAFVLDVPYIQDEDITGVVTDLRLERMAEFLDGFLGAHLARAHYHLLETFQDLSLLYAEFINKQAQGYDGVILKKQNSPYFADVIKIKRELTLDPVVIGEYVSETREVKSLLIAVWDIQTKLWIPIGKVSERGEEWQKVCDACRAVQADEMPNNVLPPPELPDIWLKPEIIVQVTGRWITPGATGSYVLRVEAPRDIFLREEKGLRTSTTFEQLMELGNIATRPPIPFGLF